MLDVLLVTFTSYKVVSFSKNPVTVAINDYISGIPETNFFMEFSGNINNKIIYSKGIWYSIKDYISKYALPIEFFKPISKEDFYRTDYTQEEARKLKQDYYDYALQFAPSEP